MTCKLHINVLDSCNRATGNFYLSAITGLAGGRQLVVTAGLPPIRQICGAWQPSPLTPLSPQPPHPLCEKSERDGIGLPDFPKVLPRIILSCTQKPPTARHPMGMLAVWNWQSGIGKGEPGVYSCGKVRPFLRKSVMENDQVQPAVLGFLAVSREVARAPSDQLSVASG